MAKKQILNYKFVPGIVIPDTDLFPNTYALLEANKKFIIEETIEFIQYNINNDISPYVFYTYNADKCRRDISYVLEGYISDLRKGGNWQTVNNASKYFENGIPQVDGDRQPEVVAHTFIKGLIQNFILENIEFTGLQSTITQIINLSIVAESGGKTKLATLNDIIINVIDNGLSSLPVVESNRGYIKFPGYYKLKDILLITNTTRNVIMYNFADPSLAADLTYNENFDEDFPGALYGNEKITTIIFDFDTSQMMVTDAIQLFVEGKEQPVRLNSIATDAMERQKVGIPQSMLDADFEYGLQPTKWQAIGLMRNYPSIYEIPGSDISVLTVVTDASSGTSGSGSSLITVTTENKHGLLAGTPITIKALANSITGFSRAEGSFLVNSVPSETTFTYYAKSKVGTISGQQLSNTYTQLRKGSFYTGSAVGSPSFNIVSQGTSGTVTTSLITPAGSDIIGFTGSPPPIGSPLTGTGIDTGSQVTAVAGSGGVAASTTLTLKANIGDTSITVNDNSAIGPGLVFDRGDGVAVAVTDIVGNTVSLSGSLSSTFIGTTETYSGLSQSSTSGDGASAVFNVSRNNTAYITTVVTPGASYAVNDTILIDGTSLGGTNPANNATITVTGASPRNTVSSLDNTTLFGGSGYSNGSNVATTGGSGTGLTVNITTSAGVVDAVTIQSSGSGYTVGNTVTIAGSPGVVTGISSILSSGSGYTTGSSIATTGGSGTGLRVNVTANDNLGTVQAISVTNPGSGYTTGVANTSGGSGTSLTVNISASAIGLGPTIVAGGSGYANTTYNTTGGSGSGLTLTVSVSQTTSLAIVNPGTGYTSGIRGTSGGTGVGLTLNIVASAGVVTGVTIDQSGSGYINNDVVTINTGGGNATVRLTITLGVITSASITVQGTGYVNNDLVNVTGGGNNAQVRLLTQGGLIFGATIQNAGSGYTVGNIVTVTGGSGTGTLTVTSATNGQVTSVLLSNPGIGYTVGNTITVSGGGGNATFTVEAVTESATIDILSVAAGGVIQTVSTTGIPITAPSRNFISAFTINTPTNAQIASGFSAISYGAIATVEANFVTAHGFVPGNTITVQISSGGANAQLAAGAFFVEQVPTATSLRYVARATGSIANTLVGVVYARPDSFFLHRPFDGGVQLGTGGPAHGASAIRMSKKYIRYQSGKGVMYNTGALFAPSYDINTITATGTAANSVITIRTDDTDHGCQVGSQVTISGVVTSGYNGIYTVSNIIDERTFDVIAQQTLGSSTAVLGSPCQMTIRQWHGATVRAGIFDDQNGMFYQYDGQKLAVVRRSSTFQIAGVIAINANSNLITGTNTRFTQQLANGDKIVIRGMTHTVTQVVSNTQMTVAPDYRGVNNATNVKICKTIDIIVPQENWNLDQCNGSGPSGYNLDIGKMQMIGIQHTWYGAGFIDFMLRGPDGNYIFVHRFRNSNVNTEAYMRTGNQPVRYEVVNEGARGKLLSAMTDSQTVVPLEDAYFFPTSGTVLIDSELIRYTGNTGNSLTGCTRGTTLTQFTAGSQRTFSGGAADIHSASTGVVLVSNTITPIISHWGSAFMIDGQFDSDRGYIFNYAATGFSASVNKTTAFLIRLAPSVSNAQIGDLGERELLNRAQLLLSSISVTSDGTTGGVTPATISGAIVVEGVLNPSNYPEDPTKITWTGLGSQAAGGQPSFAQIASGGSVTWGEAVTETNATVQGAFTTTMTAVSFAPVTTTLTATSFGTVTNSATAQATNGGIFPNAFSTSRNTILIPNTTYDAFTTPLVVGDTVFQTSFCNPSRTITGIARNFTTIDGIPSTRITMNSNASATSGFNTDVANVVFTSSVATRYTNALSNARNDFLIPQSQAGSTSAVVTDVLSLATFITGSQTISSITQDFAIVNSVAYARVIMSANANASSTSGAGNNQTVTVTSAATARYASALSTGRNDFLITNAQYNGMGIAVGDGLSLATFITGGQTISSITQSFITIGATTYTRIVMSANANSTSTAGGGNNQTVTATATGSAATYVSTSFLFFTSATWNASGANIGTKVAADQTQFPAGTTVNGVSSRTFGANTVFRVSFTQASNATISSGATIKFQFGALYALPGEQVFSFISNPGETSTLSLEELKELTSTAIGGRGTFPNGPDVLAINVYKVSGDPVPANVILRWGEAQA
jgi:hypothetical protein